MILGDQENGVRQDLCSLFYGGGLMCSFSMALINIKENLETSKLRNWNLWLWKSSGVRSLSHHPTSKLPTTFHPILLVAILLSTASMRKIKEIR